jgi:IS5 family transposase
MFETRFLEVLNSDHELLRAARLINWDRLHEVLSSYYSPVGRSGKPIRLMVGIHILKHRYNCSDERAVEILHENAYWQCFCGFEVFQKGQIMEASSMVKFRNRIGAKGMKQIEEVLLKTWGDMGLVKTRKVIVDTTSQPKDIAYPTDADLLHRVREKMVRAVQRVRKEVTLKSPFRSFSRVGKKVYLTVKKFYRKREEQGKEGMKKLQAMVRSTVHQAGKMVNTLYARGEKVLGKSLNRVVSLGKRVVTQTEKVLKGERVERRIYSLHEPHIACIKKGKHHPSCEFGSLVALSINEEGLILAHREYQENVADVKTLPEALKEVRKTVGVTPMEIVADRGFDQPQEEQEKLKKRWKLKRVVIPKKGKKPHPDHHRFWFKKALKKRVIIEPIIGHLKNDHRMNRCRYQGIQGDTANMVFATLAWNTKKIVHLAREKEEMRLKRQHKSPLKMAA